MGPGLDQQRNIPALTNVHLPNSAYRRRRSGSLDIGDRPQHVNELGVQDNLEDIAELRVMRA
jgi:hypothetical protein